MTQPLIELKDATKVFVSRNRRGEVSQTVALNHVNLALHAGETVGLVGESGSGKTTLGRCLLTLEQLTSGSVHFNGEAVSHVDRKKHREMMKDMQIIFQDPYAALNPRLSALEIVKEPLFGLSDAEATARATEMLAMVGITGDAVNKRPKAFSGGQRQRIGIARAIVNQPKFVLCDEPTSALDVSIQAQILQLLVRLQKEFHLTYLFITHDLSVVRYIADRIAVMYRGYLVEVAPTALLFNNPQHPYTKKLLATAPVADPVAARQQLEQFVKTEQDSFVVNDSQPWLEVAPGHFVRQAQ